MDRFKRGISILEVAIAIVIAGLAIGPVINLLSVTNKETTGSIYSVTAAHYANEIAEQLLGFDVLPGFKVLCDRSGRDLTQLLEGMNPVLEDKSIDTARRVPLGNLDVFLLVSPLSSVFQERSISVFPISTGGAFHLPGDYFRVTIRIGWNAQEENPTTTTPVRQVHETVIFVRTAP